MYSYNKKNAVLPAFRKVRHYRYWIQLELINQKLFPVKKGIDGVRLACVKHIADKSIESEVDGPESDVGEYLILRNFLLTC